MFPRIKLKRVIYQSSQKKYQSSTNCEGDSSCLKLNALEGNSKQISAMLSAFDT